MIKEFMGKCSMFFYLLLVLPISGRFLFAELILEAGKFVVGFYWEINFGGLLLEALRRLLPFLCVGIPLGMCENS